MVQDTISQLEMFHFSCVEVFNEMSKYSAESRPFFCGGDNLGENSTCHWKMTLAELFLLASVQDSVAAPPKLPSKSSLKSHFSGMTIKYVKINVFIDLLVCTDHCLPYLNYLVSCIPHPDTSFPSLFSSSDYNSLDLGTITHVLSPVRSFPLGYQC